MIFRSSTLRGASVTPVAVVAAAIAWAGLTGTAEAASDVQITRVDCQSVPRSITIANLGDIAQDLTGWKLLSDLPGEEFDLSAAGTLDAGARVHVYNGNGAPEAPELIGGEWIYPWSSQDFALRDHGPDFVKITDPAGYTVSHVTCPIRPADPSPSPSPSPPPAPEPSQAPPVEDSVDAVSAANAASNVRITEIGCSPTHHPPYILVLNLGEAEQSLAGWRLESQPDETFPLDVAGSLSPGETITVFNGHGYNPKPGDDLFGLYPWNPGSFDYAIVEDGSDFVRLINASGNEVNRELCPPPVITPSPQPTQVPPTSSGNTDATNSPGPSQTDGSVQDVPGRPTTAAARGAQARGPATSGEQFGPPLPASDSGIPSGGGPPLHRTSLPLVLMSLFGGAAVTFGGLYLVGQAIRRPGRNA